MAKPNSIYIRAIEVAGYFNENLTVVNIVSPEESQLIKEYSENLGIVIKDMPKENKNLE